jgi:hypothetical protein
MPLEPGGIPSAAVGALERAIAVRAIHSAFATSNLRRANVRRLAWSTPHRVEYLPLERIRRENSLRVVTRPSGWRCLIHESAEAIAAARVAARTADKYALVELSEGVLVTGTEAAVRVAEGLEQVRGGRFEVTLLLVPELYVAGLWLQNLEGKSDLVVMIPTAGSSLELGHVMELAAFWEKLSVVANRERRRLR